MSNHIRLMHDSLTWNRLFHVVLLTEQPLSDCAIASKDSALPKKLPLHSYRNTSTFRPMSAVASVGLVAVLLGAAPALASRPLDSDFSTSAGRTEMCDAGNHFMFTVVPSTSHCGGAVAGMLSPELVYALLVSTSNMSGTVLSRPAYCAQRILVAVEM